MRVEADTSDEKIASKIKRSQMQQIPWMLVVGGQEEAAETATLRLLDGSQTPGLKLHDLVARASKECNPQAQDCTDCAC